MAAKKKTSAAAPKSCVKKFTLTLQPGCQDIRKFYDPKVSSKKTYAAAAQSTLPKPAPKPAPVIDLVTSSSSETFIIDDIAKGPASVIATTTSTDATASDADAPLAATTSDADAPVASTSHGLIFSSTSDICIVVDSTKSQDSATVKATYASIAAKPCDASAHVASTSRVSCGDSATTDPTTSDVPEPCKSNELQKIGTASTSSSPTTPNASIPCDDSSPTASRSPASNPCEDTSKKVQKCCTFCLPPSSTAPSVAPSKRRQDAQNAPPPKRRRENSSSSTLASLPTSSSPPSTVCTATPLTPSNSSKRRRGNSSSSSYFAPRSLSSSTHSTSSAAISPTPSSSTDPPRPNNLTNDTTLEGKLAEGYKIVRMTGDGSCFFRACSYQRFANQTSHAIMRHRSIKFIEENRKELENPILAVYGGKFENFLEHHKKESTFADDFTISALAGDEQVQIIVYRPGLPANVIEPLNGPNPRFKPFLLAYVNKNHYDAIIPLDQKCSKNEIVYGLNGAALSQFLKRSNDSIAMDYITPRRTLPARRSKFAAVPVPVIDNGSDDDSVFEADAMQSDDDYEMEEDDGSMQSDDTSVIPNELSNDQPSTTMSESGKNVNVNEESSNVHSPSSSTGGAAKKDQAKLTADEKLLLQLHEEFVKLYHRRDYYSRNNEQPQLPYGLEYKLLALSFFYSKSHSKEKWWTAAVIIKWVKDNYLFYKNHKNKRWDISIRDCLRSSKSLFAKRGQRKATEYSFIATYPEVNKVHVNQLSQLVVSPQKPTYYILRADEKYDKDFIDYHKHQTFYSKNDVSPNARTGGLIMYFFFSHQKNGTSFTLRDITKWMEDNIMHYRNKASNNWHTTIQTFLKRHKYTFPKFGSQKEATYTFNGTFPQLEKDIINGDAQQIQPIQAGNQKKSDDTYIYSSKTMICNPKHASEKDEDFIYFHQHRDFFSTNNVKPQLQYGVFVRYLFYLNKDGSWFTLRQIYNWIEKNVLYYKIHSNRWRGALRNYLTANSKTFPPRGSGHNIQYSYNGRFPEVSPNDICEQAPLQRKQMFTRFIDQPIIDVWNYINDSKIEIRSDVKSYKYRLVKGSSRVPNTIKYLLCVDCCSKNFKRAYELGQYVPNLTCTVSKLQLNDGVLRGNYKENHLCEHERYADVSGQIQYGIFTAEDSERYIENSKKLDEYMAGLMEETMKLKILDFVPKTWLNYDKSTRCTYLYGLSYSTDPRSFWYIGVTMNPWYRFPHHAYNERPEMFKYADGSKREVLMTILLCMPSHHHLAYELEATLISYGKRYHHVLHLPKKLTNVGNGEWQNIEKNQNQLQTICRSTRNLYFTTVGRALRALLDDGAARGPRISSLAIGLNDEMKAYKKEWRRLKSS